MNNLQDAFSPTAFRRQGHQVVDFLADKLTEAMKGSGQSVNELTEPESSYQEIKNLYQAFQNHLGSGNHENQIVELFDQVHQRSIRLHNPRYMGHQISPTLPVACLASMMGDLLNNGMGVFEMGVAGTAIERFVIKSLAAKLGFGQEADGYITSGGTLGNLTALLAARRAKASSNVWKDGTAKQFAVMVSDQAHYCIDKAVRVMGWGDEGIILIESDNDFRMKTETLPTQLQVANDKGIEVVAVIGSACSTATGSFDDLIAIGEFCERNGLWFHVDGAHGAATIYSSEFRHLLKGIDVADSVTMDFHKLLMTPALATALVFKEEKFAAQNFSQKADYLWNESEELNQWHDLAKRTFECTKSMVGFKVFTIMAMHGEAIFDENVTAVYKSARRFASLIKQQPDFELATEPQSNILCFRHIPSGDTDGLADGTNELNAKIRAELINQGDFYIVQTKIAGETWLRTTIANAFTSDEHFQQLITTIRSLAIQNS